MILPVMLIAEMADAYRGQEGGKEPPRGNYKRGMLGRERVQEEKDETHRSRRRTWSVGTRVGHLEEATSVRAKKSGRPGGSREDEAWKSRQEEDDGTQRSNCGSKARRIQEE